MNRTIEGFHEDAEGDWVAELSCLHSQHVRHRPPFWDRPWVEGQQGRDVRIGSEMDCPLCDRTELPTDLVTARTAGPFDETTLPSGLRRAHRVAERTWGLLRVLDGSVGFTIESNPPVEREVGAGESQPIPPGVRHAVHGDGPFRVAVDFLVRSAS